MKKFFALIFSHAIIGVLGFAAGIYALPILIAPQAPTAAEVVASASDAQFSARFERNLEDSDAFHWGDGDVSIGQSSISLKGKIAPGPDYKLYLSPQFVETEKDFKRLKNKMVRVANVKTFDNFIVSVPDAINPSNFNAVVIWCEAFGEFITAAKYQ